MQKKFIALQADDKLDYIVKTFAKNNITSAPVLDGDEFLGVVSDIGIAEYFLPKKFMLLWKRDKPTPIEEIKNVTAGKLAKKSTLILNPEQKLLDVLPKIVKRPYCIAVMEEGKLAGIVSEQEINSFFLKELAKDEVSEKQAQGIIDIEKEMSTEVDTMISIVNEKGEVTANEIAKQLGISVKSIERLGESLSKHHLVEMKYSFFKGALFKRLRYEKGK